jgi:translation initiation factor IF-3
MGSLNIGVFIIRQISGACVCRRFFYADGQGFGRNKKEVGAIAASEPRLNEEITISECRLIDFDGNQMGVYPIEQAQRIADAAGLDLVEIAPNAQPPVCRVMNYGKFKYDQAIKAKQARKNQTKIEIKEMKFRPKIDVGDYTTKKKHVLRFLEAGNKVKITIMFRGREMAHPDLGLNILERLADDLKDVAVIENQPKMEGRNMHMLIAPLPSANTNKKKKETDSADAGAGKESDNA